MGGSTLPGALFTTQSWRVWDQLLLPSRKQEKDVSELLLGSPQPPPNPSSHSPLPPHSIGEPVKGRASLNVVGSPENIWAAPLGGEQAVSNWGAQGPGGGGRRGSSGQGAWGCQKSPLAKGLAPPLALRVSLPSSLCVFPFLSRNCLNSFCFFSPGPLKSH